MSKISSLREEKLIEFQRNLNLNFKDLFLLNQSLIHTSYVNENKLSKLESNERLELLGDAVLNLVTTEYLYEKYQNYDEGDLTKIKSVLVSKPILAKESLRLNIGEYILLGKGEEILGGRKKESLLANVFESLIGAYYLDSGLGEVKKFIVQTFLKNANTEEETSDFKTKLQEFVQGKYKKRPVYIVLNHSGPQHQKVFLVKVCFRGNVLGKGKGVNKKEAEQQAAKDALEKINGKIL
ncbi:MAG: ribonuclease III [Candidatus Firestonebacteria bacterium]